MGRRRRRTRFLHLKVGSMIVVVSSYIGAPVLSALVATYEDLEIAHAPC